MFHRWHDPADSAWSAFHACRRALSLPAALSINVSQAAFRSMLDLTTPFCIVMAVNAANYLLNELLMVIFPYGMAGCGWASVISQVSRPGISVQAIGTTCTLSSKERS